MTKKQKKQKKLGSRLRRLREQQGIGIKTASKELGVSYAYLSRVENDQRTPSSELVEKLSSLYGVDAEDILARLHRLPSDIREILDIHGKDVYAEIRKIYSVPSKPRR